MRTLATPTFSKKLIADLLARFINISNIHFGFIDFELTAGLFLSMAVQSMVRSPSRRKTPPDQFEWKVATIGVKALRQKTIVKDRPHKPTFLCLPGELRNAIYELVLEETTYDLILNLHVFRIPIPKLALACEQIFREVLSVHFTKDDSGFYRQGHESGGDLDFSVIQTPMLSTDTRRWAERCAMLGAPLHFKHLGFMHLLPMAPDLQPRVVHGAHM
ncbi:hypothetical protein KCU95_g17814, partial [Aureobasidium melanogenum]